MRRATWLLADPAAPKILATTEERREVGIAKLADGTLAASSGEQVGILDPDGGFHWAQPLPYDGMLVAATRDRFVFGPDSGGVAAIPPDGIYAIERGGRITGRLRGDIDAVAASADRVFAIDRAAGRGVVAWDPATTAATAADAIAPPPARRPTERDVKNVGYETTNPRDDWATIGIEITNANFLALRGTYGGSTGVCSDVPLRVGDGAIATFVDCDLTTGSGGEVVQRAATVIAIRCKLPGGDIWQLGRACHLVLIDCTYAGTEPLKIFRAPTTGATVTCAGATPPPTLLP
jgi:hypothetical protein